jgi:hypothetical protein
VSDPAVRPFTRGDYGAEYASELIELVERDNCSLGCTYPDPSTVLVFGPGGDCDLLIALFLEVPVPEFRRDEHTITCLSRQAPGGVT